MEKKKIIAVGVFKNDIFPYFTLFEIVEFAKDGSVITPDGLIFQPSSLLRSFSVKSKDKLERERTRIRVEYSNGQKKLRTKLLAELKESFPNINVLDK